MGDPGHRLFDGEWLTSFGSWLMVVGSDYGYLEAQLGIVDCWTNNG